MKNKGFTLIELLAVIVILAIISAISIPIVLNIISDLRKDSTEISMKNIEKAASLYFQQNSKDENIVFECSKDKCKYNSKELELNGKAPESGKILIDKTGNITYEDIVLNGFNCYKEHDKFVCDPKKTRKVYNESEIIINSDKEYNLFDYNIYGNSVQNEETLQYKSVGDKIINLVDVNVISNMENCTVSEAGDSVVHYFDQLENGKTYTLYYKYEKDIPTKGVISIRNKTSTIVSFKNKEGTATFVANDTNLYAYIPEKNSGVRTFENFPEYLTLVIVEGNTLEDYKNYDKYKISIKVSAKNLYNKNSIAQDNVYFSSSTSDDISPNINFEITGYLEIPSSTKKITMSIPADSTTNIGVGAYTVFYDENKKYLGSNIQSNKKTTMSIPTGSKYFRTSVRKIVKDVWIIEPENNQLKTENIYLDEPLRKLENKADYIDFKNGKVVRYIEEDNEGNLTVLSVPKEEKIELPEILLHKRINNIEIETSIKPSKIELEYYK